jgi:hypothetical protein
MNSSRCPSASGRPAHPQGQWGGVGSERRCGLISRGAEATRLHAQPSARAPRQPLTRLHTHTIFTNLTSINLYINASIRLRGYTHRIENFNVDAFAQEHFADPKQRAFVSDSPNLRTDHRSEYYVHRVHTCVSAVVGRPTTWRRTLSPFASSPVPAYLFQLSIKSMICGKTADS